MNSLDIVNSILVDGGYTDRIPSATRDNIAEVGNTILNYAPTANAFFSELINRIGRVIITRMDGMEDIYGVFKEEKLDFGDTVQKIFVDIPKAQAFDGTATTQMLTQSKSLIHVEYTKVDRKFFYKVTVSVPQIKEAFTSVQKLDEFIMAITSSMATALEVDKYIMVTNTLFEHCKYSIEKSISSTDKKGAMYVPNTVAKYNLTSEEIEWDTVGAKQFLKFLRIASRALKFPHELAYSSLDANGEYVNSISVPEKKISAVKTSVDRQVLGLEVSTLANIDVDALAVLFHLEPANLETKVIELEDGALGAYKDVGGSKKDWYIGGFICAQDAVERGKSYEDTDSFKNPEGQYVNFWQHYWGYMAVSKLKDFVAIVFETYTPSN